MTRRPITRAAPYTPATGLVPGATFTSERQYRNALARARGFSSWAARQRAPRLTRSTAQVHRLGSSEQLARRQALEALGLMRRDGLSLRRAAARAETTPAAVIRHAGPALARTPGGRYRAAPADHLFRPLLVLTTSGLVELDISDSAVASVIGSHWSAIGRFLETGDATRLGPFRGRRIGRFVLETDPALIEELGRRGELSFEDIYRS
jgi:hypothetical protein